MTDDEYIERLVEAEIAYSHADRPRRPLRPAERALPFLLMAVILIALAAMCLAVALTSLG